MLLEPLTYYFDIEYGSLCRADWVFEGLQTRGAKVEGEAFEVRSIGCLEVHIRASAGRICIGRGPFGMGDLSKMLVRA